MSRSHPFPDDHADRRVRGPWPLARRIRGVVVTPRATFEALRDEPKWLDVLIVVAGVMAVYWVVLLATDVGRQALVDQLERQLEAYGFVVSDAKYEDLERLVPRLATLAVPATLVGVPLLAGLLSAVVGLGLRARRHHVSFRQILSVVAHSGVVLAVHRLVATGITLVTESTNSPTNLAAFLPMLEETSFLARLLGSVDLFTLWWTLVLACGVGVLFRRPVRPIAVSIWATYGAVAALLAAVIVWRGIS